MSDLEATVLSICLSLTKLQGRLLAMPRNAPISEMPRRSPWLQTRPPSSSVGATLNDMNLVLVHLLAQLDTKDQKPAARYYCCVLHFVSGPSDEWSDLVRHFAGRFGVQLPSKPSEWTNGRRLSEVRLPIPSARTRQVKPFR